jgi:hypothetical protein
MSFLLLIVDLELEVKIISHVFKKCNSQNSDDNQSDDGDDDDYYNSFIYINNKSDFFWIQY